MARHIHLHMHDYGPGQNPASHKAGQVAGQRGERSHMNPHDPGSSEHEAWHAGWSQTAHRSGGGVSRPAASWSTTGKAGSNVQKGGHAPGRQYLGQK
jgi:hypothetical protein